MNESQNSTPGNERSHAAEGGPKAGSSDNAARNTPSEQRGQVSQGSRAGSQAGSQAEGTGMGDGLSQGSSQGLAGAQGSGGGAERGMQQSPMDKGRPDSRDRND
jgi:hypothetical protein